MQKFNNFFRKNRGWFNLFIFIFTLSMSIYFLMGIAPKVIKTGFTLIVLRDNAQFYQEQPKTDRNTEEYIKSEAERQAIYNSEDSTIRNYANSFILVKVILLIFCIVSYILIPLAWYWKVLEFLDFCKWKEEQKSKKAGQAAE